MNRFYVGQEVVGIKNGRVVKKGKKYTVLNTHGCNRSSIDVGIPAQKYGKDTICSDCGAKYPSCNLFLCEEYFAAIDTKTESDEWTETVIKTIEIPVLEPVT